MKIKKNNFDKLVYRKNTGSLKYDGQKTFLGFDSKFPMWVADMDFETPEYITKELIKRAKHGIFGYDFRNEKFFKSLTEWFERRHQWNIPLDSISFVPGIVPGLSLSVLAFTKPGDKIIVQPPVYFPFFSVIKEHDRQIVLNPLINDGKRLQIDFDNFEQVASQGAKMFIISNPHNPGGSVWTESELKKLAEICLKNNILIISDDIHCDLVYKDYKYTPIPKISEEIANNTILFTSPSKTFNVSGLSSSACVITNKDLKKQFDSLLEKYHISHGNIFGNFAFKISYKYGDNYVDELMKYLKKNVDYTIKFFNENIPEIKVIKPESTFLIWLDCNNLNLSDTKLNYFFLKNANIGLNTGIMFGQGGEGFMRMNIGCSKKNLEDALQSIYKAYKKLKKNNFNL